MPVQRGNLKEADFIKIQMNYVYLMQELDGRSLVNEMFASRVFTLDDKQEIEGEQTRNGGTEKFLQKLLDSGPKQAYDVFLRALEIHYPHVAQTLKVNVSEEGGEPSEDNRADESSLVSQGDDQRPGMWVRVDGRKLQTPNGYRCKNPEHSGFIPINKFDRSHLPSNFQQPEVVEYVKVLAEQTVSVRTFGVSSARPEGYPFCKLRGKRIRSFGTGRVWRIMRPFSKIDDGTCPCVVCKQSSTPVRQWGQFIVVTAKHLVFDDEECVNTKLVLWYDEAQPDQFCPALLGVRVIRSDIVHDYSEVLCVTHEKAVSEKLEAICRKNEDLSTQLARMCYQREPKEKLTIIVSHPHGLSKHVSVGEWVEGDNDDIGSSNKQAYKAAACPGSAGAPVLLLDDRMSCCTTHSRFCRGSNANESGGKLWPL